MPIIFIILCNNLLRFATLQVNVCVSMYHNDGKKNYTDPFGKPLSGSEGLVLPMELLVLVLSHCAKTEDILSASATCHRLHQAANDNVLPPPKRLLSSF